MAEKVVPLTKTLVFKVHAKSLNLPVVQDHPNRLPFTGILTKVGLPSDEPPNGSDGKRVLLTKECCEAALDSLLGMGIDLAHDMKGHDTKSKIGVITSATVDGEDLNISGFLYAADFPAEALKILRNQAELGFSFEAQNLAVESLEDDPLIVKSCVFTGAAILMKNSAAYQTTAIAAAKAQENEHMTEVTKAVQDAIAAAMAPFADQMKVFAEAQAKAAEGQTALSTAVDELKTSGGHTLLQANAAMCATVEPHAKALEAAAEGMEKSGIGLESGRGHVAYARRMASALRSDAASGRLPHAYHDSGSYWAGADPNAPKPAVVEIKDSPEFKAMQAAFDTLKTETTDKLAAAETKLIDMKAAAASGANTPQRKTLTPEVIGVLNRYGIEAPGDGQTLSMPTIDKALASAGLDTSTRLRIKTSLVREGVISNGAA